MQSFAFATGREHGMPRLNTMTRAFAPLLFPLLLLAPMPGRAMSCESLQAEVEAKIRAAGVKEFTVTVVDSSLPARGRVVGTCARGSKRLVYSQGAPGPASESATRAATPKRRGTSGSSPMLTECKDGRVITTGDCSR